MHNLFNPVMRNISFMKLCPFFALFFLGVLFFNFNPIYAQKMESSNSTNATASYGISDNLYRQGNVFFSQGKYQDAISYYDKALSINSSNINALYNKGLALDQLGKLDDAISNYDKVLAITPNDTSSLYNKAYDLDSLGKYDEAISYYDMVLGITPNDTSSLNNIGLDLDNLGRYDEALQYYDKVIALSPNDTNALYNEGVAFDSLGKHDKAIIEYEKVLSIDPANVGALNKLNLTYNNANQDAINGIQQSDVRLLVAAGIIIAILGGIIIIDMVKKAQKSSTPDVLPNIAPKED